MFKKMIVPALVLAAASVALPAAAQSHGQSHGPSHSQSYGRDNDRHNGPSYNHGNRDWQSINQRQSNLSRRIDVGVRNGSISRREATRLRNEFNQIARLEQQYRRNGLTNWERTDLDRRFDRLSAQVRNESRDNDNRRH